MDENEQSEVKPVSIQRIEANRRNALKSTGPKTAEGKANVRFNAVKHGFFSQQIVISSKAIGEDPKDLQALLQELRDHYEPANIAEEVQVDTIAVCLWRERRALRCELGEVRRARFGMTKYDWGSVEDRAEDFRLLKQVESELEKDGEFSSETESTLARLSYWISPKPEDLDELAGWREEALMEARSAIAKFESMGWDRNQTDESASADCHSIPDAAALNRILKYQALNDRRLQRALTQLERLQRQRKGDYVPPPVKVSVDGPLDGE